MSIYEDVNNQMKDAMKAGEKARLMALRNIRKNFIETMKLDGSETLTDESCVTILRRMGKASQESIEAYVGGGREDLAVGERVELAVIEAFLPQLAGPDVVRGWVQEAIAAIGATSPKDMGKVMGALGQAHKGEYDGKLAQQIVKELLG